MLSRKGGGTKKWSNYFIRLFFKMSEKPAERKSGLQMLSSIQLPWLHLNARGYRVIKSFFPSSKCVCICEESPRILFYSVFIYFEITAIICLLTSLLYFLLKVTTQMTLPSLLKWTFCAGVLFINRRKRRQLGDNWHGKHILSYAYDYPMLHFKE